MKPVILRVSSAAIITMGSRMWLMAVLLLAATVGFHGKTVIIFCVSF